MYLFAVGYVHERKSCTTLIANMHQPQNRKIAKESQEGAELITDDFLEHSQILLVFSEN